MENLSLSDNNGPRGLNTQAQSGSSGPQLGPTTAQGPPQLPPQMFTTAAQLLDLTDSMTRRHIQALFSGGVVVMKDAKS